MSMWKGRTRTRVLIFAAAALVTLHCSDATSPERQVPRPSGEVAAADVPIQLDQQNGVFGSGTFLIKGFNPTNPHVGDAILATIFWFGAPGGLSGNIIDSVTDVLTTTPFTPVGNKYELVDFVSDGTISMATYLATNVQNFPDAGTANDQILAVRADFKVPVTNAGLAITAWIGVAGTMSQALGEHRNASGTASLLTSPTIADPGAISLHPGALAYGVSLVSPPAGVTGPSGWTLIGTGGDLVLKNDDEYDARFTLLPAGGTTDPQWSWFFTGPGVWLASVLALNPAPTTGNLMVTTSTSPPENVPTTDYTITLDGTVRQPIPPNGSVTLPNLVPGAHAVALSGLPANCALTSDNPLSVTVVAGETATAAFSVTCNPPGQPPAPNDKMTGGGKLRDEREFATFGFEASARGGKFTWVQHCPDNDDDENGHKTGPATPQCSPGKFTFKGTVTPGTYAQGSRGPNCRTWSGTGTSKQLGSVSFTVQACDGRERGRGDDGERGRGRDYIEVTIGSYQNSGFLAGGNIQLGRRHERDTD